jgi:hypothetical protein
MPAIGFLTGPTDSRLSLGDRGKANLLARTNEAKGSLQFPLRPRPETNRTGRIHISDFRYVNPASPGASGNILRRGLDTGAYYIAAIPGLVPGIRVFFLLSFRDQAVDGRDGSALTKKRRRGNENVRDAGVERKASLAYDSAMINFPPAPRAATPIPRCPAVTLTHDASAVTPLA